MSETAVTFRLLSKDTDPDLLFRFNKEHGSTPMNFIPDGSVMEHFRKVKTGETFVWGAFIANNELAGLVSMEAPSPYYLKVANKSGPGSPQDSSTFIHEFVVHPKLRGQRVGQRLLASCVDRDTGIFSVSPHIQEVYTTAHADNMASIMAFVRAGFKEVVSYDDPHRKRHTTVLKFSIKTEHGPNCELERREIVFAEDGEIDYVIRKPRPHREVPEFAMDKMQEVANFYKKIPEYNETLTPLIALDSLSEKLGLKQLLVKDEEYRFNLLSFKALGGLYATARVICDHFGMDLQAVSSLERLKQEIGTHLKSKPVTIVTASDGNHGRGIAWTCSRLGIPCVVYLPKGTVESRVTNISMFGAKAIVLDVNYDDTVQHTFDVAEKEKARYLIIQDVDTADYQEIPLYIMRGYGQIAKEVVEQLDGRMPTHVILQVGVGAFASSCCAFFQNFFGASGRVPKMITFEPMQAAPMYKTARCNEDALKSVGGDLESMMAGLACGVLTQIGGHILNDFATAYVRAQDFVSKDAIRILANPLGSDRKILSGESGGVGVGLMFHIMTKDKYADFRKRMQLNKDSTVLVINTEGITDPVNWNKIMKESSSKL